MVHLSLNDIYDDLFARFVMNLPKEEIDLPERLGFQLEQAWWFYDDFYRPENNRLPKMNLKSFISNLLIRYPDWIQMNSVNIDSLITTFLKYKSQVPTCGAILLNPAMTKCLMVQGWNSSTWTFPKGKIAKGEAPEECAAREVEEEVGFDVGPRLNPADYIQMENGPHAVRLYIIPDISESTQFQTLTRKEIGAIKWMSLAEISNPNTSKRFYNVGSFLGRLKAYIKRNRAASAKNSPKATPAQPKQKKVTPVPPTAIMKRTVDGDNSLFSFDRAAIEAAFTRAWTSANNINKAQA